MRSPEQVDKLAAQMATPAMPVVTALYGGLNALFNIYLANRVSTATGLTWGMIAVTSGYLLWLRMKA